MHFVYLCVYLFDSDSKRYALRPSSYVQMANKSFNLYLLYLHKWKQNWMKGTW